MSRLRRSTACGFALSLLFGLAPFGAAQDATEEPQAVVVQHILVGFKRSVPGKKIDRTKKQAGELAAELLERARGGEDFDALVREFTDDRHPGVYKLTNRDTPLMSGSRSRDQMVPSFGDIAFSLDVGEIGLAEHHAAKSPYGWHVIKRLE